MSAPLEVVVIGAVACGAKAASRIRRLDPRARITMIDQGRYISFAGCGLPYAVGGRVRELDELLKTTYERVRDEAYFRELKDVEVLTGTRALVIDREAREVEVESIATGERRRLGYDRLVIATGATATPPPVPGLELRGIHHLTRMEDAAAIRERLETGEVKNAVVVGAGFIGLEAAEALVERGVSVTVVERDDQAFPWALDPEVAALVGEHLFEANVRLLTNEQVDAFEGEEGRVVAVRTANERLPADLVVLGTGVRPNVTLAREAGLEIGPTGAIAVDDELRTSDPEIFAGGDCAELRHVVTAAPAFIPLGSTANKHGRVIGDNVCGGHTRFPGVLGTFVCEVLGMSVGSTGLTERAAREAGFDAMAILAPGFDRAHYYPGAAVITIKLVAESKTGRLLGVQAVGKGEVARRIDVAATALSFGANVEQIAHLDLAYAPPFATALDALITAANAMRNRSAGLFKPVHPLDMRVRLQSDEDFVLLDVRSPLEFGRMSLDDERVVNLPLDELRARIGELPRDKTIICACQLGLRSFTAQRILEGAGFENVATLEGGLHAWPDKDDLL